MEEWRTIPGWENYQVSNAGRVKSIHGNIIKQREDRTGYLRVNLRRGRKKQKTIRTHRLVALAWLGEPPTPEHQVDHKNGDRQDNRVENLEYVTRRENYMRMAQNQGRFALADKFEQLELRVAKLEARLGGQDG